MCLIKFSGITRKVSYWKNFHSNHKVGDIKTARLGETLLAIILYRGFVQKNTLFNSPAKSSSMLIINATAMTFLWVSITPLLTPVVPDEYNKAAVSLCFTSFSGNSVTSHAVSINDSKLVKFEFEPVTLITY
ncbi:hypothetical protein MTR_4g057740 [Medicago truncatula]|uniref:Uncharacterized protein n=1 Tax=Medicago truncatula TaxID=3880 RepID=A0A072UVW4_MEDTR|nr:hypothetical protein MTR_4g057740 [Medicago truncatula]